MRHARRFTSAFLVLIIFLALRPAALRADTLPAAPPDQLGKINFPTSCSADVQPTIEKGVALLHSFQYKESGQTFADAATRDPKCAMAHWGKAMALFYQLWEFPDDKKLKEGHKDTEKARKLHPASAREQGFLQAAAIFYQKKSKLTHTERIKAYSDSLERFYAQSSGDAEIGAFYALSLVSLSYADEPNMLALQQKAISVLQPLLQQHPEHPGVAHYMIHATDRPEFAAQGLDAARRYAAIAPDSAHAIHMPSHIFVRLGLWQDSITSNIAANASGAHAAEMHTAESHYQTHAMDFLSYSYLQSGQEAKAREVIEHTDHVIGANEESKAEHRAYFAARTALELHRWKEAAALPIPATRKAIGTAPSAPRAAATWPERNRTSMNSPSSSPNARNAREKKATASRTKRPRTSAKPKPGWPSPRENRMKLSRSCAPPPAIKTKVVANPSVSPPAKCSPTCYSNSSAPPKPSPNTKRS